MWEEPEGAGDVEAVDEAASEPAEAELEAAVAVAGAVFEEVAQAPLEDGLGEGVDPEGGEGQDEQEAVDAVGGAQAAGVPLPAERLEVTEQLLFLGAVAVLPTEPGRPGGR